MTSDEVKEVPGWTVRWWGLGSGTSGCLLLGIVTVLLVGCVGHSSRRGGWPAERIATLAPDVRSSYEVFATRCSRCHTLSRPLTSGIDDIGHWRYYVTRMRRMPGSGISESDAKKVLVFLKYYAEQQRRRRDGRRPSDTPVRDSQ